MFLEKILSHKRDEVARQEATCPLAALQAACDGMPRPRDFSAALAAGQPVALIAEIKRQSPSKGLINGDFEPLDLALTYERSGAAAISVLTDERFFGGHLRLLRDLRQAVSVPLLRKDFIIDPYQVYESRAAGADALLLIVAALSTAELERLLTLTHALGMVALVEAHTAEELQIALEVGAQVIGINNRDLHTFETDLTVTERLAPMVPRDRMLVSASGIRDGGDVQRMRRAGARAVLVGESLMRQADVAKAVQCLLGREASGCA